MSQSGELRVFLALPLAEYFSREISGYLGLLEKNIPGIKWCLPEQVHITLHFFGPVPAGDIQKIRDLALPVHQRFTPMKISLQNFGCFPSFHQPRVLWLGVHEENGSLPLFQQEVEKILSEAGYPIEKREFHPHATLGRIRQESKPLEWDVRKVPPFTPTPAKIIDHTVLYQSHLGAGGARYEVLETFSFSKKPASSIKRTS